jgi:hypothetical protein
MWKSEKLKLEFKYFPEERPQFLLGSIALAKRFQKETFISKEAKSYLSYLFKQGFHVYHPGFNTAYYYYRRGVLKKDDDQYKVIMRRMRIIERELRIPEYAKYVDLQPLPMIGSAEDVERH